MRVNISEVRSYFAKKGYRLTPQRDAILKVMTENHIKHLKVEDIYELLLTDCPEIGLATIYRMLQILENIRLVNSINLDDGFIRYQLADPDEEHEHHHLICDICGSVIDLHENLLEDIEKQIMLKNKFKVTSHNLKFYGQCEKCISKN